MQLVNADALAATDVPDIPTDGIDPAALADPEAGPSLRAFLVLTHCPRLFVGRGWTAEEVLWSRFYWFRRFVRLRIARSGPDAGLEQQACRLLEDPEPECSPDWSHLEWVEALAERDAADQLRTPWSAEDRPGSHPIVEADIGRLATLAGVTDPAEWGRHIEAESRIPGLVAGDVRRSWEACLPTWLEQGRIRDLSRAVRVPMYRPSFAKTLGDAFVERHWQDYPFLLELLERHPFDSVEYLCAYDLLEGVVHEFASRDLVIPDAVLAAKGPLPPVIRRELPWDERQLDEVGRGIARLYAEDYAPGDEDLEPREP
jgi:hypothetical protein